MCIRPIVQCTFWQVSILENKFSGKSNTRVCVLFVDKKFFDIIIKLTLIFGEHKTKFNRDFRDASRRKSLCFFLHKFTNTATSARNRYNFKTAKGRNLKFRVRDLETEAGSGGSGKLLRKRKLGAVKMYRFHFHFGHSYRTLKLECGADFLWNIRQKVSVLSIITCVSLRSHF